MRNYQNGKIYAIRSYQTDDVYIGSTTQSLSKRFSKHKEGYKRYLNGKDSNVTSYNIIKFDDVYIELIENYPCNSKEELCRKEGQIIRQTENCVNKRIERRTKREYYTDNKETINEKCREYHATSNYYENNKERLSKQNKEWYEKNKEKMSEYDKKYKEKNKDKFKCVPCEYQTYNKSTFNRHLNSKRHTQKINLV